MGMVYRQKGRTIWMIKYFRNGKPVYESSESDVKDDATKLLRQR